MSVALNAKRLGFRPAAPTHRCVASQIELAAYAPGLLSTRREGFSGSGLYFLSWLIASAGAGGGEEGAPGGERAADQ